MNLYVIVPLSDNKVNWSLVIIYVLVVYIVLDNKYIMYKEKNDH